MPTVVGDPVAMASIVIVSSAVSLTTIIVDVVINQIVNITAAVIVVSASLQTVVIYVVIT